MVNLAAMHLPRRPDRVSHAQAYRLAGVSGAHAGRVVLDLPGFEVMRGEVPCLIGPPGGNP